jgi:hypothetical protein
MRAVFGAVSLLVVLALVAFLAARQLKSAAPIVAVPRADAASTPTPGNVAEQVRQAQQQVGADVAKALEQGAAARNEQADK